MQMQMLMLMRGNTVRYPTSYLPPPTSHLLPTSTPDPSLFSLHLHLLILPLDSFGSWCLWASGWVHGYISMEIPN